MNSRIGQSTSNPLLFAASAGSPFDEIALGPSLTSVAQPAPEDMPGLSGNNEASPLSLSGTALMSMSPPPVSMGPPPVSMGPPPVSMIPSPLSGKPPPLSMGPPPVSIGPPAVSRGPPPLSSVPPPVSSVPPPAFPGPPPNLSVGPPHVTTGPPPSSTSPLSMTTGPPPSVSMAPPSITTAPPPSMSIGPPPVTIGPPPSMTTGPPPPVSMVPPPRTNGLHPTSIGPPALTTCPPPSVSMVPPPRTTGPPPVSIGPPPLTAGPPPAVSVGPPPAAASTIPVGNQFRATSAIRWSAAVGVDPAASFLSRPSSAVATPLSLPSAPSSVAYTAVSALTSVNDSVGAFEPMPGPSARGSTGSPAWSAAAAPPPTSPAKDGSGYSIRRGTQRYQRYAPLPGLTTATSSVSTPLLGAEQLAPPISSVASELTMNSAALPPAGFQMMPVASYGAESASSQLNTVTVTPLTAHWFYATQRPATAAGGPPAAATSCSDQLQQPTASGCDWSPFSNGDSCALESAQQQLTDVGGDVDRVSVLGGRYDADVAGRLMRPLFWNSEPLSIRRCSWFSRGAHESGYVPYSEQQAIQMEELFQRSAASGSWHQSLQLDGDEGYLVLHSPTCLVHHPGITHAWENVNLPDDPSRPRQVRRGWDTVESASVPADETETVNHLVFMVHGIGAWCDLKFRKVNECVDDMRRMAAEMVAAHFGSAVTSGRLGRVEFMPISWHDALHCADTGIDEAVRPITLRSIPLMRDFTNDTILDILYYTSPVYCQVIIDAVAGRINSIYSSFCRRHPEFRGSVSLVGHSLGSLILFDLLSHQPSDAGNTAQQPPPPAATDATEDNFDSVLSSLRLTPHIDLLRAAGVTDTVTLGCLTSDDVTELGLPVGPRRLLLDWRGRRDVQQGCSAGFSSGTAGTGQPTVRYPTLSFRPACFFGLGSPIALFTRVRGLSGLDADFRLPTCGRVFNIFHPFDPVAYRLEPLIDPALADRRPVLVPHHKGRKRMHLEIKEQMVRMGSDLKQKLMSSLQSTLDTVYSLGWMSSTSGAVDGPATAVGSQLLSAVDDQEELNIPVGVLNGGRRIDYVLQEKPFESLNEYVFAFQSHLCYWDSEDTLLMMLKEMLQDSGIECDSSDSQNGVIATSPPAAPAAPATVQSFPAFVPAAKPAQPVPMVASSVASVVPPIRTASLSQRPLQVLPSGGECGVDPTAPVSGYQTPPPPPPTSGFKRS